MKIIVFASLIALTAGSGLRAENEDRLELIQRELQDIPDVNETDIGAFKCYACEVCANNITSFVCDMFEGNDDAQAAMDEECAECDYIITGDDGGLDLCFSEVATVQVLGQGQVTMKDLQVGDKVLTGMNKYETVYAFAHRLPEKPAQFYQIHNEQSERPLEVTADHLVFLSKGAVAADTVQVGDELEGGVKVTKIDSVQRNGIYAPLTTGGSLIVDGVKASNYIRVNGFMDHALVHTTLAPYRMFCAGVAARFCDVDYNSENGMPYYVQYGLNLLHAVSESGILVQGVAWPVILGVTGSFWTLELLFGAALAPLMVLLGAVAYAKKGKGKSV